MLLRHAIGHVLRRLRLERGLTLRSLGDRSRVSLPYLSEIERGRKEASSEIIATLCRVLDVSAGELLTAAAGVLAADDARRAIGVAAPIAAPAPVLDLSTRLVLAEPAGGGAGASALLLAA